MDDADNKQVSSQHLSKVAHDLKAPIRHIASFSELLSSEATLNDEQQTYLDFIQDAANSLGIEIDKLVQLLRAANETARLAPANFATFEYENKTLPDASQPTTASPEDNYRHASVLYVEDSMEDAALFIKHCNAIHGYQWKIDHITSYQAARQAIKNRSYDLYFFDYHLDEGTGIDLVAELKTQRRHGPVLVVTGLDDAEIGEQTLIAGATGYAPKHQLSPDVIYRIIRHSHIRRQAEIKLEEQACEDGLTGAFNRSHFIQLANIELARAKRFGYVTSLAMIDIDQFKEINDQHGHLSGDKAIIDVVNIAQGVIRASDVFARFGGDEFVILMPQTTATDAHSAAERLRKAVDAHASNSSMTYSVSIGITTDRSAASSVNQMIDDADAALYQAKQAGRNRVVAAPAALEQ